MAMVWMNAQGLRRQVTQNVAHSSYDPSVRESHAGPVERRTLVDHRSSSRWTWVALLAAMLGLLLSSTAKGSNPIAECEAAGYPGQQDEWAVLEYEVEPSGIRLEELELAASSTWDYGSLVRSCVSSGRTQLPRNGLGAHTLFRYRPSQDLTVIDDRRLDFRPSKGLTREIEHLEGKLALRLEIDASGDIRSPELLFASNAELGALVLDHLHESLAVIAEGRRAESRVDVLYIRFRAGELMVFSQLSYTEVD